MPAWLSFNLPLYGAFLVAVVAHEAAHAVMARRLGEPFSQANGFATLNPIPHLRRSLIGMVVVPFASQALLGTMIGWASVPLSLLWVRDHRRGAIVVSLAGPLANLGLALGSAAVIAALLNAHVFVAPAHFSPERVVVSASQAAGCVAAARALSFFFTLNVSLFLFNLLPFPTLDGGQIVLAAMRFYTTTLTLNARTLRVLAMCLASLTAIAPGLALWRFIPHLFYPRPFALVTGDAIADLATKTGFGFLFGLVVTVLSYGMIVVKRRRKERKAQAAAPVIATAIPR